jgi:hypothetical protein
MSSPLWLVGKLTLPPSMRRHLCRCRNGNCCSRHDGVITVVDAQAFSVVVKLALSPLPLVIKLVVSPTFQFLMALLPLMRRVFAIVTIAIFTLMTMASSPLSMHRCPCYCGDVSSPS